MRNLNKLINDISHPDASRRRRAAEALSKADIRAVYYLIKALQDENQGVQDAAINSLSAIGGEATAYMVLPLLREDPYLRNAALVILKNIGADAVPLLYPLLGDKDPDIRKFGIDLLSEIKEGVLPEKITPLIKDPNPNVRVAAIKGVGALGYTAATNLLINALYDTEWACFAALEALGRLKSNESVEQIGRLLSSKSEAVRYAAIEALGEIGSQYSVDILTNHFYHSEGIEKTASAKSLLKLGITPTGQGIKDVLCEMLVNGEWDEKLLAIKGLVDIKDKDSLLIIIDIAGSIDLSIPGNDELLEKIKAILMSFDCEDAFIEMLGNKSIRFRGLTIVIEILGNLSCKKAVPNLINLLGVDIRDVRRASIFALSEIKGDESRQALISSVNDYDSHVRKTAITALGKIGDKEAFNPIANVLQIEKNHDIIEEAVNALLKIDRERFLSMISGFNHHVKEIAELYNG